MKKILILGGSGLVGSTLVEKTENDYMITATFNKNKINSKHCKLIQFVIRRDLDIIHSLINDVSPDIVVNTIAYSDVDFCETHQDEAKFLHVDTTREIAKICNELKIKLIYISTDWVLEMEKIIILKQTFPIQSIFMARVELWLKKLFVRRQTIM